MDTKIWSQSQIQRSTTSIASFTVPSNISSDTDLIFALTVADSKNASSIDNVKITSRPALSFNKPPIANAGEDMMVNAGNIVKLNGTGSKDPDGKNITSYVWDQIVGSHVVLKGGNTSTPTFSAPSNITSNTALVFQLTVKDDKNATSISPVKITVKPANHSPSTNAGLDRTVNAGDVVTLDGSKSSDQDNDPLTYIWKQLSGPNVRLNSIDKPFAIFTAPKDISSDTDMRFELTVTDSKNATSKDSVKVTVKYVPPPNQPPVANAGPEQTVNSEDEVTLDGRYKLQILMEK